MKLFQFHNELISYFEELLILKKKVCYSKLKTR